MRREQGKSTTIPNSKTTNNDQIRPAGKKRLSTPGKVKIGRNTNPNHRRAEERIRIITAVIHHV
jgi:hypothetical protein